MTAIPDSAHLRAAVLDALAGIAPESADMTLDPGRSLRDQLDLDSFDFLQLLLALHAKLGVDIPEADYAKLQSVDGAVRYLEARLGAPA